MATENKPEQTIFNKHDYTRTIVPNEIIYNENISWEVLGIMVAILTFPEEKKIIIDGGLLGRTYKKADLDKAIEGLVKEGLVRRYAE